jgi:hypothetical protein
MTQPENLRYHAAGHLSAANDVMQTIKTFVEADTVDNPPQVKEMLDNIIADITTLEGWFVDPFNTKLEDARHG